MAQCESAQDVAYEYAAGGVVGWDWRTVGDEALPRHDPLFTVVDTETGEDVTGWREIEDIAVMAKPGEFASNLVYCDMDGWYVSGTGELALLDECGNYDLAPERYEVVWADGRDADPGPDPIFRVVDTEDGRDVTALAEIEGIATRAPWGEFASHLIYCDMDDWYVSGDGILALLDECGNYDIAPDRYEVVWATRGRRA